MNLFTALFLLNLTFLSNEWVAGTGSNVGCVIIATVMHYSMLTTFTWFALQALHLYLRLIKMSNTKSSKNYMLRMCIPAWGKAESFWLMGSLIILNRKMKNK